MSSNSAIKRVVAEHRRGQRTSRVRTDVRLPFDVHGPLAELARLHSMSFNALLVGILRDAIKEHEEKAR